MVLVLEASITFWQCCQDLVQRPLPRQHSAQTGYKRVSHTTLVTECFVLQSAQFWPIDTEARTHVHWPM